jgi:hypothetical protein
MPLVSDSFEAKKFDTRIVERNVDKGALAPKEVEKMLKDLPDDAANAQYRTLADLAEQEKTLR